MTYFIAILCVLGIAGGQLLFKLSASHMHKSGSFFEPRSLMILFVALALYGITTLAWVWVLQKIELGRAYPLMALALCTGADWQSLRLRRALPNSIFRRRGHDHGRHPGYRKSLTGRTLRLALSRIHLV